jgi:nucleoside-diphosphate-sugar epimerase
MTPRILVTGAAGYLGSVLVGRLLDGGFAVRAVDALIYGQTSLLHYCGQAGFEFVRGDVRNEDLVQQSLSAVDAIVPLAALVGAPVCSRDPWSARAVNFEAIAMLARLRSPSQLIVFPNTNSIYGHTASGSVCTEDSPLAPVSVYAQTKYEAEQTVLGAGNSLSLRMATMFGASARMRTDLLVNDFVYSACTARSIVVFDHTFRRNFVHVRDAADCITHCLENAGDMAGGVYNLGLDESNLTKGELAMRVASHVPGCHVELAQIETDPDRRSYTISSAALAGKGFVARRSLDAGIEELKTAFEMWPRSRFGNV